MSKRFLLQTIRLLFLGQVLLGGLGWLLVGVMPWAGLPVTFLLAWFLYRVGLVFREELKKAVKREEPVAPGRLALFVGLAAQLPGLALLPYWAPWWVLPLWQGAVLPLSATLGMIWPAAGNALGNWIWVAAFAEIALFAWVAAAPERQAKVETAPPVRPAAGEWVAARRHTDVQKRGRRVK
jgi:hypothetical protein